MLTEFKRFQALFPPRPMGSINPAMLDRYKGFIAQYKYNDVRCLVYIFPDGSIQLYNRYRAPLACYTMSDEMEDSIQALDLPRGSFQVLDGGLLHGRGGRIRDRLVLWDILVHQGRYLLGTSYLERYRLLTGRLGYPDRPETETSREIALQVNQNIWLAPIFRDNLTEHYRKAASCEELEGIMLKNPNAALEWGLNESNNGYWQIRVRKPLSAAGF